MLEANSSQKRVRAVGFEGRARPTNSSFSPQHCLISHFILPRARYRGLNSTSSAMADVSKITLDMIRTDKPSQERRTKIVCTLGPACWDVENLGTCGIRSVFAHVYSLPSIYPA
jgi:hypothetical protein